MNKLEIGKRYSYKNHIYEIVNFGRMKENGTWLNAVGYKRVLEEDEDEVEEADITTIYTRNIGDFKTWFIPRKLEIGDQIFSVSMGKHICGYEAIDINESKVRYKRIIGKINEPCELVTTDLIDFNGRIYVLNPDKKYEHINCLEYYYLSYKVEQNVKRQNEIECLRSRLINISETLGKIDTAVFNDDSLLSWLNVRLVDIEKGLKK